MKLSGVFKTNTIAGYWIIRLILAYVFLLAGLQKFVFPDTMGPGRFLEMGFPLPVFTGYLAAFFEVACGLLIFLGLAARLAAVPLITIMSVAILTTKIPRLQEGFLPFANAARLDIVLLLLAVFVVIHGADALSLDRKLHRQS